MSARRKESSEGGRAASSSGSRVIYTIGHSNQSRESFIALLHRFGIERLADARARPASRFASWSNKKAFAASLPVDGIEYVYLGDLLGGLPTGKKPSRALTFADFDSKRKSEEFKEGLKALMELARSGMTAAMCAEENPSQCHRGLLIAPGLAASGFRVIHIRRDGRLLPDEELARDLRVKKSLPFEEEDR